MADNADNEEPIAPEAPKVIKLPHKVKHAHAPRRVRVVEPTIKAREDRQKRSRQSRRKATIKPSSSHTSPRPNRGAEKRSRLEKVGIHA